MTAASGSGKKRIGRPSIRPGETSVHVGLRLAESEHAALVDAAAKMNARREASGEPSNVTVGSLLRMAAKLWLTQHGAEFAAPSSESTNGVAHMHSGTDERHVRAPSHKRSVRSVAEGKGEPETPIVEKAQAIIIASIHETAQTAEPEPRFISTAEQVRLDIDREMVKDIVPAIPRGDDVTAEDLLDMFGEAP